MYDTTYLIGMSRNDILSEQESCRRKVLLEHLGSVMNYRIDECTLIDYCDIFFSCDAPIVKQELDLFLGLCDTISKREGRFSYYDRIRRVISVKDIDSNVRFKWHVMRSDKDILSKCVYRIAECYKFRNVTFFKAIVYAYVSSHGAPPKVISDFFSDSDKIKTKDIEMYTRLFINFDWSVEAFMALTIAGYTFSKLVSLVKKIDCDSGEFPYWSVPDKLIRCKIQPYRQILDQLPEVPKDYVVPREFFD